jgi:hypothetical protein
LQSDFKTIIQKWSPYWEDVSCLSFGSLPWRSRSQHDLAAKSCPVHNLIILSYILKLFHRNDHYIEMMFHVQYLGGPPWRSRSQHDLQENRVRTITLIFIVGFYNCVTEMITILRQYVVKHLGCFYTLNFVCDIRGIPSCLQNLFGEHKPVQPALGFIGLIFWYHCNSIGHAYQNSNYSKFF